jgi:hypothetical protein
MAEMNNEYNSMYGVVRGLISCGSERTQDLSDRISARNVPSSYLQPQIDMRPVSTKYAIMPILDRRARATEPIVIPPTYNITQTFNPGTANAPWSGFPTHINDESKLRNQFFALQKGDQAVYVPSTSSDLYIGIVDSIVVDQPFPGLFAESEFSEFNPNVCNLGNEVFDNCTRVQLRNT